MYITEGQAARLGSAIRSSAVEVPKVISLLKHCLRRFDPTDMYHFAECYLWLLEVLQLASLTQWRACLARTLIKDVLNANYFKKIQSANLQCWACWDILALCLISIDGVLSNNRNISNVIMIISYLILSATAVYMYTSHSWHGFSRFTLRALWVNDGIESIKTTSMEDASTRVLEKLKNI